MLFDKLCQIAERHVPEILPVLAKARLFDFPYRAQDILPETLSEKEVEFLRDQFFLPFECVAIEDKASCTLLMDSEKDQLGVSGRRTFVEFMDVATDADYYDDGGSPAEREKLRRGVEMMLREWPGACIIAVGEIVSMDVKANADINTSFRGNGYVTWSMVASKQKIYVKPKAKGMDDVAHHKALLRNARAAMSEVFYFNNPTRWVVETKPAKIKLPKKKTQRSRPRRSMNRPVYTLLTPKEIRTIFDDGTTTDTGRKSPAGHDRRRHPRTYRDDKFKKMKNKTVIIPATWIGPSEVERGGKRYKVMLDL